MESTDRPPARAGTCRLLIGLAAGAAIGFAAGFWARGSKPPSSPAEPVAETPGKPKEEPSRTDVLELAVEVNRILDPEVDEAALRAALEELVEKARRELEGAKTDEEKVSVLNRVLLADREVSYLSNIRWRDTPFAASVLRKKGNCLSTTTLFVVAGEMLGLPVCAVHVPTHVFVRFEGARPINIETTAGGQCRPDSTYRAQFAFGDDDAREFGYGKSLSADEFGAILLLEASNHLCSMDRMDEALGLLERADVLWPENLGVRTVRAHLLYQLSDRRDEALRLYGEIAFAPEGRYSRAARAGALLQLAGHGHALGKQDDALVLLRRAFFLTSTSVQSGVLDLMSSSYRTRRDFPAAALTQELAMGATPDARSLTGLAIMYKNADRLEDAIRALRGSLTLNPESWNTRLILAGYLIRARREEEGWEMFATVEEPRGDKAFYCTNMAWFYGSVGKKEEFLGHLEKALSLSRTPHILNYIRTEVDFDRYRSDPDFVVLVERHRARLSGER